MSNPKVSKLISAAVALALCSASVLAQDTKDASPGASKGQKIGMASGAIAGAIVGGPFGAAIGFIVGSVTGTHAQQVHDTAKKASSLETELADTQQQLASAQVALASAAEKSSAEKSSEDSMLSQLAQRLRADVMFRTANAELDPNSSTNLSELGAVLANYPGLTIEIDGYADPRGKSNDNMELSQQRASAVRAALIVGGAKPDNIRIAAHGAQLSTASKGDLEAYAWERRVSLSVAPSSSGQVAQAE